MREDKKSNRYKSVLIIGLIFITYIFLLINLPNIWGSINDFSSLFTPFILGFVIGIFFGFVTFAVLSASRRGEDMIDIPAPDTGDEDA